MFGYINIQRLEAKKKKYNTLERTSHLHISSRTHYAKVHMPRRIYNGIYRSAILETSKRHNGFSSAVVASIQGCLSHLWLPPFFFTTISRLSLISNRVMPIAPTIAIIEQINIIKTKNSIHPSTGYILQWSPCKKEGGGFHGEIRRKKTPSRPSSSSSSSAITNLSHKTYSPPSMTTSGVQVRCRSTMHFSFRNILLRIPPMGVFRSDSPSPLLHLQIATLFPHQGICEDARRRQNILARGRQ